MPALAQLPAASPEAVLTVEAVAARFHVEPATVRRWMQEGKQHKRLGHFHRGRVLLTTESLLVRFWAANEVAPPSTAPRASPLERVVLDRAYHIVGELVKLRRVRVEPAPGDEPKGAT